VPAPLRLLAVAAATGAAVTLSVAGVTTAASAAPARTAHPAHPAHPAGTASPARAAPRPGRAGKPITLANNISPDGFDAATDAHGTTYIGWIASHGTAADRTVYLCTLPRGKTACAGGIQHAPSLGGSSASGLRVLATPAGQVTLVWFHDTTASENGPDGSEIATATRQPDGSLSAPADAATGPSFGNLLDAALAPGGGIWVVTEPSSGSTVQIRPGLGSAPVTLHTPYGVGDAGLAFSGSTAVLAIQKDGSITVPVSYADHKAGSWSGFRTLARTWTAGANLGLVHTTSGIRLLAAVPNADYWPVVSRWTGSSFSRPQPTGDRNNCAPRTHDPVADASGRLADVSQECENLAVANLSDTLHAAVVRFSSGGTLAAGIPQITTTPRGRGWVVWAIESSVSDRLLAVPVLLPGRLRTVSKSSHGDRAVLSGPASCLPPTEISVRVTGSPARHWHVVSRRLRLDGRAHSAGLNGAALTAGRSYTLTGLVTFADGGARRAVTAGLKFRSCPNP
jgi:hypothetical protein